MWVVDHSPGRGELGSYRCHAQGGQLGPLTSLASSQVSWDRSVAGRLPVSPFLIVDNTSYLLLHNHNCPSIHRSLRPAC
jgi:hypothetical protein